MSIENSRIQHIDSAYYLWKGQPADLRKEYTLETLKSLIFPIYGAVHPQCLCKVLCSPEALRGASFPINYVQITEHSRCFFIVCIHIFILLTTSDSKLRCSLLYIRTTTFVYFELANPLVSQRVPNHLSVSFSFPLGLGMAALFTSTGIMGDVMPCIDLPLFLMSGAFLRISSLPTWMYPVKYISHFFYAMDAVSNIYWRQIDHIGMIRVFRLIVLQFC